MTNLCQDLTGSGTKSEEAILHLVFLLQSKFFAIAVQSVDKVVIPTEINEVPGAPETLCGIMNLRGEALSVLDITRIFGYEKALEGTVENQSCHLIIVNSNRGKFGLPVDKALKVFGLIPRMLQVESLSMLGHAEYIRTYAKDGEDTILIIEPNLLGSGDSI